MLFRVRIGVRLSDGRDDLRFDQADLSLGFLDPCAGTEPSCDCDLAGVDGREQLLAHVIRHPPAGHQQCPANGQDDHVASIQDDFQAVAQQPLLAARCLGL